MAVKNIVLDIGDVICEWNPQKLLGGIFDSVEDQQQAHRDTIGHPDWQDLDRGTISLEDAIKNARQRSQLDTQKIAQIYHQTPTTLVPLESTVSAIIDANAEGVPLYVLSNMHKHAWEYLSSTFDFWRYFSGLVISSDINLIKPEPAIFQHLLKRYGLRPEETIFIDDMEVNIAAAQNAGLQGIVLTDRSKGGDTIRALFPHVHE